MSYRNELRELAYYIYTVHKLIARYEKEKPDLKSNKNIIEANAELQSIRFWQYLEPKYVEREFTPEKPLEVLIIKKTEHFDYKYRAMKTTYTFLTYTLSPQGKYTFSYNMDFQEVILWSLIPLFQKNSIYHFFTSLLQQDLLNVINFVLNYRIMEAVIYPEYFRNIQLFWKAYFGDIK